MLSKKAQDVGNEKTRVIAASQLIRMVSAMSIKIEIYQL